MPQLPNWIYFAIVSIIALATADIAVKFAAGRISNCLGMFIYGCSVFLISLTWISYEYFSGAAIHADQRGLISAFVAGISFCTVTLGLYLTFAAGAPISLASPIIRLCGLVIASLFGLIVFREALSIRYVSGVSLAVLGVYLIMTARPAE